MTFLCTQVFVHVVILLLSRVQNATFLCFLPLFGMSHYHSMFFVFPLSSFLWKPGNLSSLTATFPLWSSFQAFPHGALRPIADDCAPTSATRHP